MGRVLPFRTNNYVLDQLIDWNNLSSDPMFALNFHHRGMIGDAAYQSLKALILKKAPHAQVKELIYKIRKGLNPQPGNQSGSVPVLDGERLQGIQHKYKETVLFFPKKGQTCHAYCTFCFRWAQFIKDKEMAFTSKEYDGLIRYLKHHPEVTDLLITGGDPMVMSARSFSQLIDKVLDANITHLKTIRIGSKSLAYWPYRFVTDPDAEDMLKVFTKIVKSGLNLSFMAHFTHPVELSTDVVKKAITLIQETGAIIRTQSPLVKHVNDDPSIWEEMWSTQVRLGMVPYYMFVARDTGAHQYFSITLENAFTIFNEAYKKVSGLARTVRGPIMSASPGKVQMEGIVEANGGQQYVLKFVQGRNPEWVGLPFFAKRNKDALWLTDLESPEANEPFFWER